MDKIKNRFTGEIMCGGISLEDVLEQHKMWLNGEGGRRANLTDAMLSRANLTDAILTRANLTDAILTRANLTRANLTGADLTGANLTDAILTGADLTGADLTDAILTRANLTRANLTDAPFKIDRIHQKVYNAASAEGALDMTSWHNSCGTAHCRAGWVVTLAGDAGRTLEWVYGTPAAAALIYVASDPDIGKMPDFYCNNETALADMKARAKLEAQKAGA